MTTATGHVDYGYGPTNGPHTWSLTCHTAAGARQSPINIITYKCHFNSKLTPFKVYVSHKGHKVLIRKKHNFQVSFKTDKPTSLEGGPLKDKYSLMQLHFHWGDDDDWGSEHHIDGRSYAAELHLVFVNEKYTTMDQASSDPEGLCVIGIFLKSSQVECPAMEPLIKAMKSSEPGCETPIKEEIDISGLIPNTSRYFTYEGSLTTPPCMECVRWIVCAEPLRLSKDQLATLRSMHCCETCCTNENFRPPVPVGKRQVVCSFPQKR
ncbi:unnamed protein product [Hymenolepis diminuta]|uniref:Carbonic anhydrase n=1 Tax=Hymenolepis diminuta TaxID=6216 RepID=A0A564YF14_HYMDI|nr:unnamed protein product [Hymenolepis diminuta]